MNVILIGFMGAGKTTFGKWLADKQVMDFVDTDAYIEEWENRSISKIFEEDGEEYFRTLETRVLKRFAGEEGPEYKLKKPTVIAVGGGLPMREENRELLKKMGKIIFLEASEDELVGRLAHDDTRPLLAGGDLREKIRKLMDERTDTYDDLADFVVSTERKAFWEVWNEILKANEL